MLKISTRYQRLIVKLAKIQQAIRALQNECKHPNHTKVAKSNTGNYDPSADCYWYECRCPDCGKYWHEDQ